MFNNIIIIIFIINSGFVAGSKKREQSNRHSQEAKFLSADLYLPWTESKH